jgi:hypothetical protein
MADALKALLSLGLAEDNVHIKNLLQEKHPQRDGPTTIPIDPNMEYPINNEEARRAMKSFQKGSASGPDGFHPQYYKDILTGPSDTAIGSFVDSYVSYAKIVISGKLAPEFAQYYTASNLIALNKLDGGIRPIAVGTADSRLTSKLVNFMVIDPASDYLVPHQVGVKVPGGADAIIHSANKIIKDNILRIDWVSMQMDVFNAFNELDRTIMFGEVHERTPQALAYVQYKYGQSAILYMNNGDTLQSFTGLLQGDPLASLLFALAIHRVVLKVRDSVPSLALNVAFLDDWTITGPIESVLQAYRIIEMEFPKIGLRINKTKTELWWPNGDTAKWSEFPAEIKRSISESIKLLGAPIGNNGADAIVSKRVEKISIILYAISDLSDTQLQLLLLRSCAAMPKFMFALRGTHPQFIGESISRFDKLVTECLESIIGSPLTSLQRQRISLPFPLGGLAIPMAADIALAAHLASLLQTVDLQASICNFNRDTLINNQEPLIQSFNVSIPQEQQLTLATLVASKHPQQLLTRALYQDRPNQIVEQMFASGKVNEARTFKSALLQHSGEFLKALPIPGLGLTMSPKDFRLSVRSYLGMKIFPRETLCTVCHSTPNDVFGLHASNCRTTSRHERLKHLLKTIAVEANLSAITEPNGLLPNSDDRPADVLIHAFQQERDLAIDVNITGTRGSNDDPTEQLQKAVDRKNNFYLARCEAVNIDFTTFVVDSIGGIHPDAADLITRIAVFWARSRDCSVPIARTRLMQRISFCIKRSLAAEYSNRNFEYDDLDPIAIIGEESGEVGGRIL